jgi:hypothetical protein
VALAALLEFGDKSGHIAQLLTPFDQGQQLFGLQTVVVRN